MFEPAFVYAVVCDHCRNFTLDYEIATDGDIICFDCIEKLMEEEGGFKQIERADAI